MRPILIKQVTSLNEIQEGDALLINNGMRVEAATALKVKVTKEDGVEVIIDREKNRYFNVGWYLNGRSWAVDIRVARLTPNTK